MAVKLIAMFWPVVTAVWSPALLLASCPSNKPSDWFIRLYAACSSVLLSKLCNNYDETRICELFSLHPVTQQNKCQRKVRKKLVIIVVKVK